MRITVILSVFIIVISSCETELDIDLPQKEKSIVINSFFNDKEYLQVNISTTLAANDAESIPFIENATVLLYENNNYLDTLTFVSGGNYISNNVIPKTGADYKLVVEVPGLATATTDFSEIPQAIDKFSLDTFSIIDHLNDVMYRHVRIKFKDVARTTNYYLLYMIWEATKFEFDTINNEVDTVITKSVYGWGEGINIPHTGKLLFTDENLEGDTIVKDLYFPEDMYGSRSGTFDNLKGYFKLCTISEAYYRYGKSYYDQHNSLDWSVFAEPVTVFSNVNNGLGIFAGYGYCIDSVFYNKQKTIRN